MKKRLFTFCAAGVVVLGGAVGANAISNKKSNNIISADEAKEIAINEVDGTIKSIELEKDDGFLHYDIDLAKDDKYDDIDMKVDAKTGEVFIEDQGPIDDDIYEHDNDDKNTKHSIHISLQEAVKIATKDTPGKVTKTELDDDGYYEIEIKTANNEVEVKVSVDDGKIIGKEVDDD